MRWMRRSNRKALKALVLSFAAMAIFAGNANAAQVHDGGSIVHKLRNRARASYLSVGATAEHKLPFQSTREGGPVFMNGLPDGYIGSRATQGGVTPTNLARPYIQPVVVHRRRHADEPGAGRTCSPAWSPACRRPVSSGLERRATSRWGSGSA